MKKEFKDLTIDEKKEYVFFSLMFGIFAGIMIVFSTLISYPLSFTSKGVYLPIWHFGQAMFFYLMIFAIIYLSPLYKKYKSIYEV